LNTIISDRDLSVDAASTACDLTTRWRQVHLHRQQWAWTTATHCRPTDLWYISLLLVHCIFVTRFEL